MLCSSDYILLLTPSRTESRLFPVYRHTPVQWVFVDSPPEPGQDLHTQTYPTRGGQREKIVTQKGKKVTFIG